MTDTPRTDAAACDGTTVPADFAADVERELNAAKAEVERLRAELARLTTPDTITVRLTREQHEALLQASEGTRISREERQALIALLGDWQEALP